MPVPQSRSCRGRILSDYQFAIDAGRVAPGAAAAVKLKGRWFAVCNDAGHFYACENECPHEAASLAGGRVCEGQIICPVHHWPWDLKTGLTDPKLPHVRLRLYRCEVREGKVYVDVSGPLPPDLSAMQI